MKMNKSIRIALSAAGLFATALQQDCSAADTNSSVHAAPGQAQAEAFRVCMGTNGLWIAVSSRGKIWSSTDGVDWAELNEVGNSMPTFFRGATRANDVFIAVGGSYLGARGVIATSTDGRKWTARESGTRHNLYSVTFGKGQFVAVGDRDTILVSRDAIHWRTARPGTSDVQLASVAFGDGLFVAVGDSGTILVSEDGLNWQPRDSGGTNYLAEVGFENGCFTIRGANGVTLVSTDAVDWSVQSRGNDLATDH